MIQRLILPGRFPSLNQIIAQAKRNPHAYAKVKKQLTQSVALMAMSAKLQPVTPPVHIAFWWLEQNKRRDPDNIAAGGRKFILDGLVQAKVLPFDTWRLYFPTGGFSDRFNVDKVNPRVEITISPRGAV